MALEVVASLKRMSNRVAKTTCNASHVIYLHVSSEPADHMISHDKNTGNVVDMALGHTQASWNNKHTCIDSLRLFVEIEILKRSKRLLANFRSSMAALAVVLRGGGDESRNFPLRDVAPKFTNNAQWNSFRSATYVGPCAHGCQF